jgi:GTP-binding protein
MSNPLQGAQFVLAAHRISQLPPDDGAEVAFAGRSNAGKSSALNALTGHRGLARTSKTPGRTQQMVAFSLPPLAQGEGEAPLTARLIDLPGYGYAKVPEELRAHWKLEFCFATHLPCHVLLTKADKLSRNQAAQALAALRKELAEGGTQATAQVFSSQAPTGVDEARAAIVTLLQTPRE